MDRALKALSDDEQFKRFLLKACTDNNLRFDDVKRCLGGLYAAVSKSFYGRDEHDIIIDENNWSADEIFVLGAIFKYYKIPFLYQNKFKHRVDFPFKL